MSLLDKEAELHVVDEHGVRDKEVAIEQVTSCLSLPVYKFLIIWQHPNED